MNIGDRVKINSKSQRTYNGRTGIISAIKPQGKNQRLYYQVMWDTRGGGGLFLEHDLVSPDTDVPVNAQVGKYDYTGTKRMQNRRQRLTEIAKAAGFEGWSQLETALLNGEAEIVKK